MASFKTGLFGNLLGTWLRQKYFRQQYASLQSGNVLFSSNNRNTKKKITPVVFKKKNAESKLGVVDIKNTMTVSELAATLNRSIDQIFEALTLTDYSRKCNKGSSVIDDLAVIKKLTSVCGYKFRIVSSKEKTEVRKEVIGSHQGPDKNKMLPRPPIVTIMGHVDHGKTTLLDSLRHSNIVAQEFGGITQHIGAFSVNFSAGNSVTFLDTPGHAAFSSMRARGANVTDMVVLVVAADDGVMEQTVESIKYARAAGVPIIVAINKVDKPKLDVERTKRELVQHGIELEEFGGDVQVVCISALKGTNLDALMECILVQAEMMGLQADSSCHVEAACIESRTDVGRGKLATMLVQHGTLKKGQILVAGDAWAKVRGLFDDRGQPVSLAKPGTPVEVIGWKALPSAGDSLIQVDTEQEAKRLVEEFNKKEMDKKIGVDEEVIKKKMEEHKELYDKMRKLKLESGKRSGAIFKQGHATVFAPEDPTPKLNIIVKGDVDGSVEAILDMINTYSSNQCILNVISYGVGMPTENDIELAKIFKCIIYAFNVKTPDRSNALAKEYGVNILHFNVIYRLVNDLVEKLDEKLPEVEEDEVIGEANVLADFSVTEGKKTIAVAGCRCTKGQLNKKMNFKLIRGGEVLVEGKLMTLKHLKKDVDTIKKDIECGLSFKDQNVLPQPGDQIVCFQRIGKKQKLNWDLGFL